MRHSILAFSLISAFALTACSSESQPKAAANPATAAVSEQAKAAAAAYQGNDKISMQITGAGASFPAPIYSKWSADFHALTGGQVNYQSIGSSGGIKQIIENTVDFGASDAPMTPEELEKNGLIQFPTVIGGVVPVVNIQGVKAGELVLSGDVLAKIYLGEITKWNDEAIKALNPQLNLPDANITTVFRSDGSGTTFNFTDYLAKVSSTWSSKVGVDKSISWPTAQSGAGGKGNEGVASTVNRIPNAIGYVEYAYAKENGMAHTAMVNAAGKTVQPSAESFSAAGDIDWSKAKGFHALITNSATEQAWPIAASTFILVHKNPKNPQQVAGVLNFFNWAFDQADEQALTLDYVPFSDQAVALFKQSWSQVVDAQGQAVYQAKP
ncbi:MAG: phosphate ABC transporter substrate-binding protein PstS [Acinetobacter sp.]|nr:phosphate ABC transporter substrate-binding protein PstS [Acinetobacter sp.]